MALYHDIIKLCVIVQPNFPRPTFCEHFDRPYSLPVGSETIFSHISPKPSMSELILMAQVYTGFFWLSWLSLSYNPFRSCLSVCLRLPVLCLCACVCVCVCVCVNQGGQNLNRDTLLGKKNCTTLFLQQLCQNVFTVK